MQNILQSLVKIIIIGSIREKIIASGHQFFPLPPPLPYYPNEDYYVPNFVPPYQEPAPVFYPERRLHSPPISYPNVNYFSPPPLFVQNDNFHSPPIPHEKENYKIPEILPYNENAKVSYTPPPKVHYHHTQISYKSPLPAQSNQNYQPSPASHQPIKIIIKEENYVPYYQDDYNKNYPDEDEEYNDSYNDDVTSSTHPCANFPYHFFQPVDVRKYFPCHSSLIRKVHLLKAPITILPTRFPPRIEQLIERIQNYFSTYTQQGVNKPANNQTTTIMPPITTPAENGESISPSTPHTIDLNENETGEKEVQNETNEEELTQNNEQFTNTITGLEPPVHPEEIVKTQNENETNQETFSVEADVKNEKESQVETFDPQNKNNLGQVVPNTNDEIKSNVKETISNGEIINNETFNSGENASYYSLQNMQHIDLNQKNPNEESLNENFIPKDTENNLRNNMTPTENKLYDNITSTENSVIFESQTKTMNLFALYNTTDSAENNNKADENNISTTNEIIHNVNSNKS